MLPNLTIITNSEQETQQLGADLGKCLIAGTVISLNGNLGAGKTRFVQGVASALGVNQEEVTSPTFTLIQEYSGTIPLYHFDTYRLRDEDEFEELGACEILERDAISLLEWGDRMKSYFPESTLRIEIKLLSESSRQFEFSSASEKCIEILEQLEKTRSMRNR
ncbi:MAG: tRNA (adenosine(37)-N6)-threonylcarbamoyltransferase complex ATPase subunit type 1 TsaE [Planctomycetaceae bacterium]